MLDDTKDPIVTQVGAYTRLESGEIVTDDRGRVELLAAQRVLAFLKMDYATDAFRDERREREYYSVLRVDEMLFAAISCEREHRGILWDHREARFVDAIRSAIVREGFRVDAIEVGAEQSDGMIPVRGVFRFFTHVERRLRVRIADGHITIACSLGVGEPQPFDGPEDVG
jgi:hypothetical protein